MKYFSNFIHFEFYLQGLQFFDRILLIFIPKKYQPDYVYLKYVPLSRVHLFTCIQLLNMVVLWIIKSNPSTSIGFPVMLVVICAIRKFMECIFSKRELRLLDDLLPESEKNIRKGLRKLWMIIRSSSRETKLPILNSLHNQQDQSACNKVRQIYLSA